MSEFTQGKWTTDDYGAYVFAHDERMMVCAIRGWAYLKGKGLSDEEAIEEQSANGRLIASAPEMYAFIQAVYDEINSQDECEGISREFLALAATVAERILKRIDGKGTEKGGGE